MTILELREKRAKAWEATKAFLDSHRNDKGVLSAEDDAAYTRMEQEITDLGKEIARLERQEALDAELNRPVNKPLTGKPMNGKETAKTGRATDEYRQNFWNMMRSKAPMPSVVNALQIGTDSEGGYLVPDEYERTLVEALEEENIFRQLAKIIQTSSAFITVGIGALERIMFQKFRRYSSVARPVLASSLPLMGLPVRGLFTGRFSSASSAS